MSIDNFIFDAVVWLIHKYASTQRSRDTSEFHECANGTARKVRQLDRRRRVGRQRRAPREQQVHDE